MSFQHKRTTDAWVVQHFDCINTTSAHKRSVLKPWLPHIAMSDTSAIRSGFVWAAIMYAVLFAGHIVAAANDWDILFRLIASIITAQTFFVGTSIVVLGRARPSESKLQAQRLGYGVSLPLSAGLAYAYGNQSFNLALTLAFLGVTTLTHGFTIWRLNRMMNGKVD